MLLRAAIGFALLIGIVWLGAWLSAQRSSSGPSPHLLRRLAGQVHRTAGVAAVALLAMLALTALRLVL